MVGFLGEILDQTIGNLVSGLQAWNKEAVTVRRQLGFHENSSCEHSIIPFVVMVACLTQKRQQK